METLEKIETICQAALGRKAEDVVVMEMAARSSIASYFVVMSAPSTIRVKSIADAVDEAMEAEGLRTFHKEGMNEAVWVLMDYGDVVVHIFHHETRLFYDLERLWGDAPKRAYIDKETR